MVNEWPKLPRRLTPADFMKNHLLDFWQVMLSGKPFVPGCVVESEWEFEGDNGGTFTVSTAATGEVTVKECQAENPLLAIVMDRSAFNALYDCISQRYNMLLKKGDIPKWQAGFDERLPRIKNLLPKLVAWFDQHPVMIDLHFLDEFQDEHVVTIELGLPDEESPFIALSYDLARAPLEAKPEAAELLNLAKSQFEMSGDIDYLADLVNYLSGV